jgi:hypothetical protein
MIDTAYGIISNTGLRFNPAKSVCATFGKFLFNQLSRIMKHSAFKDEDRINKLPQRSIALVH